MNSRDAYDRFNENSKPVLSKKEQADVDELLFDFMIRKGWAVVEADGSITYKGIPEEAPKEVEVIGGVVDGDEMDAVLASMPAASGHKDRIRALLLAGHLTLDIAQKLKCSDALVSLARRDIRRDHSMGLITGELPLSVTNPRSANYMAAPEKFARPDIRSVGGAMNPNHPMAVAARSQNRSVSEVAQDAVAHRVNGRYEPPQGREQAAKGDEIAASRKLEESDARALLAPVKGPKKRGRPRKLLPPDTTT